MAAFLEDYSSFEGNGTRNEDGLTLTEFLDSYDPSMYRSPSLTADVMIFRHSGRINDVYNDMSVLMVKRRNHPCIGWWALPGGFAEVDEDLEMTARRELEEETGLTGIPIEQVFTWGETWRDPRDRIVTSAYVALVDDTIATPVAGDDAAEVCWFDVKLDRPEQKQGAHATCSGDVSVGTDECDGADACDSAVSVCSTDRVHDIYRLTLTSRSTDAKDSITLSATVDVSSNSEGLIKETKYVVTENNGIAFDHARFIVSGLLYIKGLLL